MSGRMYLRKLDECQRPINLIWDSLYAQQAKSEQTANPEAVAIEIGHIKSQEKQTSL